MPFLHNPPNLSWLGRGTKYANMLAYPVAWNKNTETTENLAKQQKKYRTVAKFFTSYL